MTTTEEQKLIEKLRRIEALFAGTTFDGERNAAAEAMKRIRQRLAEHQQTDQPIEYRFSMNDTWSRRLMLALMRRYGIRPYRYKGQRRTTVMARVPASFVDNTLWPEFKELDDTLRAYLEHVTTRVIAECIDGDSSEAEVTNQPAQLEYLERQSDE